MRKKWRPCRKADDQISQHTGLQTLLWTANYARLSGRKNPVDKVVPIELRLGKFL